MVRLSVNVPKQDREAAKENTEHGEISRKVRQLISKIADDENGWVEVSDVEWREEHTERLEESDDYPNDWQKRRREVFLRDNYICQNCGERGGRDGPKELRAHHTVPAERGGTHYMSNLQTLCHECHSRIHGI